MPTLRKKTWPCKHGIGIGYAQRKMKGVHHENNWLPTTCSILLQQESLWWALLKKRTSVDKSFWKHQEPIKIKLQSN